MKHERMREIPLSLVLKRWTKQAKSEVHSTVPKENMPSEAVRLARHGDLSYLSSRVSYLASQTKEGTNILKKELSRLEPILGDVLKQQKDVGDSPDPCNNIVRDPIRVRSKGMQGSNEPKTKPKCCLCRSYGHNKTTCPHKNRVRGRVRVVAKNKPKLRRLSDIED
ncbi:uncharacterized protein LOC133742767 [Rosa rugosa]|uniref:uncharacterized protein LOC133742767 n=1 Tax=Rosa rugosa TaxID=74645 RepID=UPI002B40B237|nr:uncharacterized protein LOC133742767 [Rosa rugosa]